MRKKTSGKGQKARVLIASSDAALRERCVLGLQDAFAVHQVSKRVELEHTMAQSKPAVLLLDLDLPQIGDVKGVSAIRLLCPSTNIILLTGAHNEEEAIIALKSGAKGYCKKEIEPSHLRKAVSVVQKGEVWVGRKAICQLLTELCSLTGNGQKDCPPLTEVYLQYLTPRERQIALLVGSGSSNKEIASSLNICERTVKANLTAIFKKLQISDRLRLGLFVAGHNHVNHS